MRLKDLMKSNVVTVKPDNSVKHAAQIMLAKWISGFPNVDDRDVLIGIITEGDILRRSEICAESRYSGKGSIAEQATAFVKNHSWKVADVMTQGVIAIKEEASVGRVAALMDDHHVKRMPETREGRLVDLLRLIATAEPDDCASGETAIRRSILSRLGEAALDDLVKLSIIVSDGVGIYGATSAQRMSERWRASFRKAWAELLALSTTPGFPPSKTAAMNNIALPSDDTVRMIRTQMPFSECG
jgi:CBS domain-containing protein